MRIKSHIIIHNVFAITLLLVVYFAYKRNRLE